MPSKESQFQKSGTAKGLYKRLCACTHNPFVWNDVVLVANFLQSFTGLENQTGVVADFLVGNLSGVKHP
ncbi:hypothetical protein N7533_008388 [Penicillium manginii]|uniref:uncharacterized protein n=1 Tax=Penicillium manginii TaxID=203109 RepID=UPI002548E776|nr:uncharacterized protein N7533_008388 [Penicillium manginii]KAJ5751360.1 hypothetical protein N7533_008388 [Penicillium manginii]